MKNVIETFEEYAEDYDKWFDSPEGKALFKMEVAAVKLLIKNIEKPFLEVGVGTGRFAKELGIEFGIDPSARVLEIAKKRGIKVKEAKGEKLPFKDKSFGGVFLLFTVCFVDDPEKVFSEAKRVLKKDGGAIIGIMNRESRWGQLYMKKKAEGHPIYKHAVFYNIEELIKLLAGAGFMVEAYSSTLRLPPVVASPDEAPHVGFIEGAGFVCILARKQ